MPAQGRLRRVVTVHSPSRQGSACEPDLRGRQYPCAGLAQFAVPLLDEPRRVLVVLKEAAR